MDGKSTARNREKRDGIDLGRFHIAAVMIFAVLDFVLLLSVFSAGRACTRAEEAAERCITAQQAAMDMQAASDYLSEQARAFIATGDPKRAEQFFEEAYVTRRRERALEEFEGLPDSSSARSCLSAAMDASNGLFEIECRAMRLAAESYGLDPSDYPEALRDVQPEAADLRLSSEEQRNKALAMVSDETCQRLRDEIGKNISLSMEMLMEETRARQAESAARLQRLIRREEILTVAMLILALILVLSTALLVTRPLKSYVCHIRREETLPEEGAGELRLLARAYNQMWQQNLRRRELLRYDATHDALTGVFNRGVFEKLRSRCSGRDSTLLILDIDRFKAINDQNGHDVGDRVLCYVAALLQENFRAEDYICRIGGDEFAVIMVHTGSALRAAVENKIRRINELLRTPEDGLPPVSLSVGVAFGDRGNPTDDIFKDADTALYRTKSVRLGGCEFY